MRKVTYSLVTAVLLLFLTVGGVFAASFSDFYVSPGPPAGEGGGAYPPGEGTSNTIFTMHFQWHDDKGRLPSALGIAVRAKFESGVSYSLPTGVNVGRGDPMSDEGRLYEFRMTAGLDLVATNTPGLSNPGHPILDMVDVIYIPLLKALPPDGAANTITLRLTGATPGEDSNPDDGVPADPDAAAPVECKVIVHDSEPMPDTVPTNRYAGVAWDRDYLYAYESYNSTWPLTRYPYPIASYGLNENFQWRTPDDAEHPDDGSTSTCWEFHVIYVNTDNLPPVPYLNRWGGRIGDDGLGIRANEVDTGVVLYIRNVDWDPTDDFVAVPMQKVDPNDNNYADGVDYVYYVEPQWWNDYVGLAIGRYEWFIACSDDTIRTRTGGMPTWLDPRGAGAVVRKAIDDVPFRHHNPNVWEPWMDMFNTSLYLDRPTLQPGVTNRYAWPADQHPIVTIGLKMNPHSPYGAAWDATTEPFYEVVNPVTGARQCGGAQNQKFDFPIMYQHLFGVTPEESKGVGGEISVWVNDSNAIDPDPAHPETQYKRYTLVRDINNPLGTDVKKGVLYRLPNPIQLAPGPHSYFFTASDGLKRVRFPVEGHHYNGADGFDGPYINNRPVLENPLVDPPTGTAGDKFRYSVTYKDPDNQRPFQARIIIEYADGSTYTGEMVKVNPADNDYDGAGVRYIFDTANMAQQFQVGQRRFYFEFIDDWGAPNDARDTRRGETVYWQSAVPGTWIYGPYINRNTRPQLFDGTVTATDGANNEATLFDYKVRYVDADNHAPKYIDVYIGRKNANGTITWDGGNRMDPIDPTDNVYSGDGAWFRYSTRLTGATDPGQNYYYCFSASDRYDVAEYDPVTSPSAGAVWMTWDLAVPGDQNSLYPVHKGERLSDAGGVYQLTRRGAAGDHPIVGPIPSAPTDNPYVKPLSWDTTDNTIGLDNTVDYIAGTVTVPATTSADIQYHFANPGPTAVLENNPPSLSQGSVSPDPGTSATQYEYRVVYSDPDGQSGQAPYWIRVRIDGIPYDMTRQSGSTEPDYRHGVIYYYRTSALSPQLPHYYYFEASDGSGYAVYDFNGSRQSGQPIGAIVALSGPYVNDLPTLAPPAGGAVTPVPGTPMAIAEWANLGVVYHDSNNEAPLVGNPVAYIRKVVTGQIPPVTPPEPAYDYKIQSVAANVITAVKEVDGQPDADPAWTANDFKDLPLQITTGTAAGACYRITANTANTITVFGANMPNVAAGNKFSIAKIILEKETDNTNYAGTPGVLFQRPINTLGPAEFAIHFTSITHEQIGPSLYRDTTVRYPTAGEITGIRVVNTPPSGNVAPVLSQVVTTAVPPVPVAYVAPSVGRANDMFTFNVKYSDGNGNAPQRNDSLQIEGYVRLIIDNQAAAYVPMSRVPQGPTPNYVTGENYSIAVAGNTLTAGPHTFYFEASDGWSITRYPAGTATMSFSVNRKPTLESPAVTPTSGNEGAKYTFSVIYKDADGQVAPANTVLLWLDGTQYPMTIDTSYGTNVVTGVKYVKEIQDPTIMTPGAPDDHSFYFTATDGLENADQTVTITGPNVYANHAPTLSVGMVNPVSRWTDSTYTYSVKYRDEDGDAPEYVKVYIDDQAAQTMTKVATENDFAGAGVTYTYDKQGLAHGTDHVFYFEAGDHVVVVRDPAVGTHTGPDVQTKPAASMVVNQPATQPRIGYSCTVTGAITPAMATVVDLTFTRPDSTTFTQHLATNGQTGAFSWAWTPDMTGVPPGPTWTVKATWAGSQDYQPVESAPIVVTVTGPSATVRGLDMISVPLDPANPFPGAVFGDGSYALARYRPSRGDYEYYYSIPGQHSTPELPLSDIQLGNGYWIKIYDGQSKMVEPSGDLAGGAANYTIHLTAGWNQIGCPFTTHVNWSRMKVRRNNETLDLAAAATRGWVRGYGWTFLQSTTNTYTGQYLLVDPTRNGALQWLEPWRGYWFRAMYDCDLIVPPPSLAMESAKTSSIKSTTARKIGWEVKLSAAVNDVMDTDNVFGSSPEAMKAESPRYLDDYVDLFFTDVDGGAYAYDVRAGVLNGESWKFKVMTDQTNGLVQVAWDGIETLPAGKTLTLTDETTGKSVVMAPGGVYTFAASEAEGGRTFRVTLGGK